MTSLTLAQLKGTIDFGIITIREDEFDAVLKRFPGENNSEGERHYRISDVFTSDGKCIRVAIARCNEQGLGEAQKIASNLISDLAPECLLAVGIAGGIPDDDFSLGDVIIATYIHDFSMEAVLKEGNKFNLKGGPVPMAVQNAATSLKLYEKELGDWMNDINIPATIPSVDYQNPARYYGTEEWKVKVNKSLERHFGANAKRRSPKVIAGPVASSDRLIENVEYTENLLWAIRSTKAVEMEVAGVYLAARGAKKDYWLTTIRGIRDVIGFERDDSWNEYVCQATAAFTYAFVKSGILIPLKNSHEKSLLILPLNTSLSEQAKLIMVRDEIEAVVNLLECTKDLFKGNVRVKNCITAIQNLNQIIAVKFPKISEILSTDDSLPKMRNAFMIEFGLERDGGLKSLIIDIQHLQAMLPATDTYDIQSKIQEPIDEIVRDIKKLLAR